MAGLWETAKVVRSGCGLLLVLVVLAWVGGVAAAPPAPLEPPPAAYASSKEAVEPDWLAAVKRQLIEREYRTTPNPEGLQAPNRAHNLRTYFERDRIRVVDRTAEGSPALLSLRLRAMGRGEELAVVAPGEIVSDGARVEIRRPDLLEWYVNSDRGLEQGFTLSSRPRGEGELALELAVAGARATLTDTGVRFETATGRKLDFGKLMAVDAAKQPVAARFELQAPQRLRIVLADETALYPVVIDPLLTGEPDTIIDGQANPDAQIVPDFIIEQGLLPSVLIPVDIHFGFSVSQLGDIDCDGYDDIIVGARIYDMGLIREGAAFVYYGSEDGIVAVDGSTEEAGAVIRGNLAGAQLGYAVSRAGDVNHDSSLPCSPKDLMVGAPYWRGGGFPVVWEGGVFVFHGAVGDGINDPSDPTRILTADGDANTIIEGFVEKALLGTTMDVVGNITASSEGYDSIVIGMPTRWYQRPPGADDTLGNVFNVGQVLIFKGSADGIRQAQGGAARRILNPSNAETTITPPGSDLLSAPSNAQQQLGWDIIETYQRAALGFSVAGPGDVGGPTTSTGEPIPDLIVSAARRDTGPFIEETWKGEVYLFYSEEGTGIQSQTVVTADTTLLSTQAFSQFGWSVSGAGDLDGDGLNDVAISAMRYSGSEDEEDEEVGAAFVYYGESGGIPDGSELDADEVILSGQCHAWLGGRVAAAGDVNADGYDDLLVGARYYTADYDPSVCGVLEEVPAINDREGAAFLFLGGAGGLGTAPECLVDVDIECTRADQADATVLGSQFRSGLGLSLDGAGDVNGDGYDDVIIGVSDYDVDDGSCEAVDDPCNSDEGRVLIFHGGPMGSLPVDPIPGEIPEPATLLALAALTTLATLARRRRPQPE